MISNLRDLNTAVGKLQATAQQLKETWESQQGNDNSQPEPQSPSASESSTPAKKNEGQVAAQRRLVAITAFAHE